MALHDTNDLLQVELSRAAHACSKAGASFANFKCVAAHTYGGLPEPLATQAFAALWSSHAYWRLCNEVAPAPVLRVQKSTAPPGRDIQILRESPVVAAVRGFLTPARCRELMDKHAGLDRLVHAHVGSGGGGTQTSEQRETLTNNMFVDWGADDRLSRTAAATFDVASELLGKRVPYEGQEPVNFLHYLKGFEYVRSLARSLFVG